MHNLCEGPQRLSSLFNFSLEKLSEESWCIMKNAESHMHIFIQYFHNSNVVCGRSRQQNSGNLAIIYFIIYKLVSFLLCFFFF